jgi:diguanylate cyclase (GGDEF)-like protein/PAS domain S-box-containing protein
MRRFLGRGPPSVALDMSFLSHLRQRRTQSDGSALSPGSTSSHRGSLLNVLFVHREASVVDCLQALKKAQFTVTFDVVLNLAQCADQLRSKSYDVIVVEYPSPNYEKSQVLQLLEQTGTEIPPVVLIVLTGCESIADLIQRGTFECLEQEHINRLPMAVRRVLNGKRLRLELEEAEKALRHSRSLYQALVDNPTYGICRCDAEGKFVEVNKALLTMLGYESKEELIAANRLGEIVLELGAGKTLSGTSPESMSFEPIEVEWNRKNGTLLKARLSGRDAFDEHGNFNGREIIAVDITEQRKLEDQLRHQASSDSLTGLANHRHLCDVLQAEIGRSKRTGREFSLLLLDLDGLKNINDHFGHLGGDRALCRVAQIMKDCSRTIDTAARHGGDEFSLVLPETPPTAALLVARRICELLRGEPEEPLLSVCIGIASYPADANTIGTLIYAADKALYAMKNERVGAQAASAR